MPEITLDNIRQQLMFRDFLIRYSHLFMAPKHKGLNHSRYTVFDNEYKNFMRSVLGFIEPRLERKNTLLIQELDEYLELILFVEGKF